MKYYLVEENGEIKKVGAQGFVPKNALARVPDKLKKEKRECLEVVEVVEEETGLIRKEVRLNAEKKQQLLDQEEAARLAAEQEASRKEAAQVTARDLVKSFEPRGTTIAQLRAEVKALSDALKELL